MNKKIRNLIIGGIVLVLLVGVLLLLKFMPEKQDPSTEESSSESSFVSQTVELLSRDENELTEIVLKNEKGTIVLHREQVTEDADPVYSADGMEGLPYNHQAAGLFRNVDGFFASQMVEENPEDVEKYGLKDPAASIEIHYTDGTEATLYFGDALPTGTGGHYGMLKGDPAVYTFSSVMDIYTEIELTGFVDTTVIKEWTPEPPTEENPQPAQEPELRYMSITGGALTEKLGDTPFTFVSGEFDEQRAGYGMSGSTWNITSPVSADLRPENTEDIRSKIVGVTASYVAAIHPDEAALKKYGLSDPYATVDFNRDGKDFHLTIGASDGNGCYYVQTPDKPEIVFAVSDENLPWIHVELEKTFSSLIFLPFIDKVSQVDLELYGKTYTFQMELGEPEEPEEGEKPEEPAIARVLYNDQELQLDNYRAMYQYFLSAPAEELNLDHQTGEHIGSITYHYHEDPSHTDTIDFYQISERRFALGLNGDIDFTSRMAYITRMEQNLEVLFEGGKPDLEY